jgi:hypothetical protein
MDDQLVIAFQDAMKESISIVQVEEAATVAASSSTLGPKRHH